MKGEYARTLGQGGGATSDLRAWLRRSPPRNWLFLSVRVRETADLDRTVDFAHIAAEWFDGVWPLRLRPHGLGPEQALRGEARTDDGGA